MKTNWSGTTLSTWVVKFTEQMQELEDLESKRPWRARISKDWKYGSLWCFHAFAEYTDGRLPPYPGHAVLEEWLDANFPQSVAYERRVIGSNSILEISFNNHEDGMLFKLGANKGN